MRLRRALTGQTIAFDATRDLVRAGGEGGVYNVPDASSIVAKLYHDPGDRREKLEIMLANPPADDATPGHSSIAWPVDILETHDRSRSFVGFVMPRVEKANGFYDFSSPTIRRKKHPHFTVRDLHIVASNAASAFWALHEKGYVVGDVNESNILIRDDALATLVDTDSLQVPKPDGTVFRCRVGREEFTPPELQGVTLSSVDRKVVHDLFGLAVLLFQLLMEGWHPFAGVPTLPGEAWPLGRRIAEGNFAWNGAGKPFRVPPLAPPFEVLDPELQRLFCEAFDNGKGATNGASHLRARPNARRWKRALGAALGRLRECKKQKTHFYGSHLSSCPWCERDARLAKAKTVAAQRSIPTPTRPPAATTIPIPARPAPPPPIDPRQFAEIQPGVWRFHANDMLRQMGGSADQIYRLHPNGSCTFEGAMMVMGVSSQFTGNGTWSYDYVNKLFVLNATVYIQKMNIGNDPFMNMFVGQPPPQQVVTQYRVESASNGKVWVRDVATRVPFLFERIS